eukprot:2619106-Pyramimonas_sp.AAC.1
MSMSISISMHTRASCDTLISSGAARVPLLSNCLFYGSHEHPAIELVTPSVLPVRGREEGGAPR